MRRSFKLFQIASTRQTEPATTALGGNASPPCIRAELKRILESGEFRATPRRREMLRFLVEETLAGRSASLKGYSLGVTIFGRDEYFDPQADPVVRLEARRLRHDLDGYYVSEGRDNPLRIVIPKGQYVPEIIVQEAERHLPPEAAAKPMDAASVTTDTINPATMSKPRGLPLWAWAVAVTGFLVISVLSYILISEHRDETAVGPALRGTALMVMPFSAEGDGERYRLMAAGIADQITAELSRFPDIRLYLPQPTTNPQAAEDPMRAGRRHGVSYVVDGSVRSDADTVRIGAKLVDVSSGRILWTGTYDRKLTAESLLEVQGEIAAEVATVLGQPYGVVHNDETSQLPREITPSIPSYECVLQAYAYRRSFARVLHGPVQTCLEAAVKRDPDYAEAWAMLGWMHLDAGRFGWSAEGNREREYNLALDAASHAVTLNGRSVLALKALSSINHYMGNIEEGEHIQRRALALNPNDPDTLAQLGWRLAVRGKFAEGIPYLRQAIDRTVNPPGWYFHLISIDHYLNGRYAEMLNSAKNGAVDGSGVSWSLVAIAHGALGNEAAAQDALKRMAAVAPALNRDPAVVYRLHQATEGIVDALVKGLRNAGWRPPKTS